MPIQPRESLKPFIDPSFPYLSSPADVKARLSEVLLLITTARENAIVVQDPHAKVLFDTTREVVKDLVAAYDLYERRTEHTA